MNAALLTVTGNVAAPPVLRSTPSGERVASFRLAFTPSRVDRATGAWHDLPTLWFRVSAWRALADHCAQSLTKGDRVSVTGRLTMSTWTTAEGVERSSLEIDARTVGFDLTRTPAQAVRPVEPLLAVDPGDLPEDVPEHDEEEEAEALRGGLVGAGA